MCTNKERALVNFGCEVWVRGLPPWLFRINGVTSTGVALQASPIAGWVWTGETFVRRLEIGPARKRESYVPLSSLLQVASPAGASLQGVAS